MVIHTYTQDVIPIVEEFLDSYILVNDCPDQLSYYRVKRSHFKAMTYDCWAAEEIIKELQKNEEIYDPIIVLENFRDRVDNYCCSAKTTDANEIFIALYELINSVIDFLIFSRQSDV